MKNSIFYVGTRILFCSVIFTILMVLVYCIPTERIKENVQNSMTIYETEGDYYYWAPEIQSSRLDNFTDALMLNIAMYDNSDSAVKKAMNNSYIAYSDSSSQTVALDRIINHKQEGEDNIINYSRYWHGYLIWLKPALCFFSMSEIRYINCIVGICLFILLIIEIHKKLGIGTAIAFVGGILALNIVSVLMCLQYSCVYYLTLCSILVVLKYDLQDKSKGWKVFLWIGMFTAFFDFLTYPVVTLGMTLLIYITKYRQNFKELLIRIVYSSVAWGCGYAGIWISKWIIAFIITGRNIILEGISSAIYRTNGDAMSEAGVSTTSFLSVLKENIYYYVNSVVFLFFIIMIIILIMFWIKNKYKWNWDITYISCVGIIGLYPLVWYMVLKNHSAIHAFMTHRILSITIFAILIIMLNSISRETIEDTKASVEHIKS